MLSLHLTAAAVLAAVAPAGEDDPILPLTQIAWQRSLEDALALAQAEARPLLVAINVDGESASDRIVPERYRDATFVAWTRRFACVVGHPYRHAPRDHDDEGRRIPCPRLGSVTCGEHIALEPLLFERYLGGERVSPRHALVLADGTKAFDLYFLFDLRELDRALEQAARGAPPGRTEEPWFRIHDDAPDLFDALTGARFSWQRDLVETILWQQRDPDYRAEVVRAIGRKGDAGSVEALRIVLQSDPPPPEALLAEVERAAGARGIEAPLAAALRAIASGAGPWPGSPDLGPDRRLLGPLARLAPEDRPLRSFLLALGVVGCPRDRLAARSALEHALSPQQCEQLDAAIEAEGGPLELLDLLWLGRELASTAPAGAAPPAEPERATDELVDALARAEAAVGERPEDAAAMRGFGLANLRLAQRRMQEQGPDIGLLLQDAETWLARAAASGPEDDATALERARAAYYLSRFDEQARIAAQVLARRTARPDVSLSARSVLARWEQWGSEYEPGRREAARAATIATDDVAVEALRWLGDAEGRLLSERAQVAPVAQASAFLRGARALAWAVASLEAKDVDYQSLASFLGAIGHGRGELAALQAGVERFPESNLLRDLLRDALGRAGRHDVLATKADWIAARNPESAACAWYAGYAWFLCAEGERRRERPDAAIAAYDAAEQRFQRSVARQPSFADSAQHYVALGHLGRGFAHRMAGRKQAAADQLVAGLALRPAIGAVRDGLDREALDLVDAVLEWTEDGPSPIDALALGARLAAATPGDPRWLQAVADSGLREGLRADGRSEHRIAIPPELREPGSPPAETLEPTEEGDRCFAWSIAAARRALAQVETEATRQSLAQSLATHAERLLVRGRAREAAPLLAEASGLLGLAGPALDAGLRALGEAARDVRGGLGDARPVIRAGR